MTDNNLALARDMSTEMEQDGTWAQLRQQVAQQHPGWEHERRFLIVRADGQSAPALMLRDQPWSDEIAEHWMAYLWETTRVGGFSVQVNENSLTLSSKSEGEHPLGVSLAFIVDLEPGHFYQGARERRPQEAAALAIQHYAAVMLPPGAVTVGEPVESPDEDKGEP
jgi:hypothetical protein